MRLSWRAAAITTFVLTLVFGVYLWILYRQLGSAFVQQDQFIPTRIYSDVTRISPPQPRTYIEKRLKALGYTFSSEANTAVFTLHSINYPSYLIPDGHPTFELGGNPITLRFDSDSVEDGLLQSIEARGHEIPDVYLEPELAATLSRGTPGSGSQIRELVQFDDIPAPIWKAIIAIEDQHYLEHSGLDPRGMARAILVNLRTLSFAQGGSTITQQLVKNLMVRRTKNIFRKINEVFLALLLEAKFDKHQILERYLNEVYLGQIGSLEVHGVAEGAKHFFGKRIEDLNLGEIAMMAGLIRGPGYYSPYRYWDRARERQKLVLRKMVETGHIAEEEAKTALNLPIRLAPPQTSANKAPYFADFVKAELIRQLKDRISEQEIPRAGFRVYTTLDMNLNTSAQQAVAEGVTNLERKTEERFEAALASVDHTNGYIRALIGGKSYAQSNFNRILNMKRQVGSTFKPLVYLSAFTKDQKGEDPNGVPYGPGHPIEDAPWSLIYDRGRQKWTPKNYEKGYMGWISFRKALAHSVNTAAAKLGIEIGYEPIIKTARALGVESDLPRVPSLALGVAELSPIELLRVYATFANHGVQDDLTVIRGITLDDGSGYARFVYHPKTVFDPGPIDLLTDMLQNVFTEGTARQAVNLGFDRPAAGKTGTTSHHRDAWFAGYTPQLTTVVWVGMDQAVTTDAPSKTALTGANSALPIWINFMKEALATEPPTPFPVSQHLTDVEIDRKSGKQASSGCPTDQVAMEKYVRDHEPSSSSCESAWPASMRETVTE